MAQQAIDSLSADFNDQMRSLGAEGGESLLSGMGQLNSNLGNSISGLKSGIAFANATMAGGNSVGNFAAEGNKTQNVIFNQNISSPKAVDRLTLYRETNSLLITNSVLKETLCGKRQNPDTDRQNT